MGGDARREVTSHFLWRVGDKNISSQLTESQSGLECAFQPVLAGHLSITASLLSPKMVLLECTFQPVLAGHLSITATFGAPKGGQ